MQAYPAALEQSGRHMSGAKRRINCLSCPSPFFYKITRTISRFGKRFRVVSSLQFDTFLFFRSSYFRCPRAQSFVKVGARAPVPWMESASLSCSCSFTPAIQSECIMSQVLFSGVFAFKVTHRVIQLTRFCKLLTRVATLSGGARASSASMARRLCKLRAL